MKTLKKTALLLSLLLLLPSCWQNRQPDLPEQPTSIRLGVTLYDQYDTFIGELAGHLEALAREREMEMDMTVSILRTGAYSNQEVLNKQVEEFIDAGCDALYTNKVEILDASVIIDKAATAGFPHTLCTTTLFEEAHTQA